LKAYRVRHCPGFWEFSRRKKEEFHVLPELTLGDGEEMVEINECMMSYCATKWNEENKSR
jgi:hypothetical protein